MTVASGKPPMFERIEIGTQRRITTTLKPGSYSSADDPTGVVEVNEPITVEEILEYAYAYPNLRQEPGWRTRGYDWGTAKPARRSIPIQVPDLEENPPHGRASVFRPSLWRRFWNWVTRRRIPVARMLEAKNVVRYTDDDGHEIVEEAS